MYNQKQTKIWKIGGMLFLALLLVNSKSTVGHAEEVGVDTTEVSAISEETPQTDLPDEPDLDEPATDIPDTDSMPPEENEEDVLEEEEFVPWQYINGQLQIYTDGTYKQYTGNNIKMEAFGIALSSDISGVVYENTVLVPLDVAFNSSKIKADCQYDEETHLITIAKRNRKIVMSLGSTQALVNGVQKEMSAMPQLVVDQDGNVQHIMVPAKFVTTSLGYKYTLNSTGKTMKITRKAMTYFSWQEGTSLARSQLNSISSITAKYTGSLDTVQILCPNSDNVTITKAAKKITLVYKNTEFSDQIYSADLSDGYIARAVSVKQVNNKVKIILKKTKSTKYYIQKGEDSINIIMGQTPIRIAVDCGHGANTPGKRTPPMPVAIDYNHDGVTDFKKGVSLREHFANVGVGKYLATELENCGFEVYRSAFGATDVSLTNRQKNIKNFKSDYSVSVHFNAAGDGKTFNSAQGVEVYYHSNASQRGDSKNFATSVLKYMAKGTPQLNRGAKTMALALCNTSATGAKASILVECAFMTNRNEAINMMGNEDYWKETAQEIAQGICSYTGVTYVN